jgi:phage tail sheath gpL-like
MSLTGIDPNDPVPADRREFIFAAGPASGSGQTWDVLLWGYKTSSGSETTNTIGTPILDDADCIARFGRRSILRWMYLIYTAIDKGATIYAIAIPEAGGATAASCTFTFAAGAATDTTTLPIQWGGETEEVTISQGDLAVTQAANFAAKINAAHEGSWPFTAAVGSAGSEHIVTVTGANLGPEGTFIINAIRAVYKKDVTTTCTKSAVTAGTGAADATTAFTAAAQGTFFYQASMFHATAGVSSTDNQIGEHINYIKTQCLPINGKEQIAYFGLVGTQAQATAVATSSGANSVFGRLVRAENSPWFPGMIAAHHAAIARSQRIAYPAANLNGYTSTDSTPYLIPPPYSKDDYPTDTEVRADVNNGVSPVAFRTNGTPYWVRAISSRSLNAAGNTDYRAREDHILEVDAFFWQTFYARWQSQKQPNVDDDPPLGATPQPRTAYPSTLAAMARALIDDFAGPNPLGKYPGPLLQFSRVDEMKRSIVARKAGPGKLSISIDLRPVEHLIGSETTLRDVSDAY